MNILVRQSLITAVECDLLLVPVLQEQEKSEDINLLDTALNGALQEQIIRTGFKGKEKETLLCQTHGRLATQVLLLIGLGKEGELEEDTWRRVAGKGRKEAGAQGAKRVAGFFPEEHSTAPSLSAFTEGFLLAGYHFGKYKSEKNSTSEVHTLTLAGEKLKQSSSLSQCLKNAQQVAASVFFVRDLVNEPASIKTPAYLGEQARKLSRGNGLTTEVWGKGRIEKEKLAGLLAVARGSVEEPRFIKVAYKPSGQPRRKVALVGKGLTFDSGGLSLKPAKSMETMKLDMSGGATVLGVMQVIGWLKPPVQVTAYVPSTENLPSGNAQKPGDIIRYKNGKTVEVLNTDAEGRLILADALICAAGDKPDVIIDLATLTGACIVALGVQIAGVFGNNQELVNALIRCSKETGEPLWQLPLVKEYKEDIKSAVADIKNIGGSAGAITAALFLEEFAGNIPWAHLDIAGPAFVEKDFPYIPKGGTGFGVRTLVRYLLSL
jgi:leucyl aminopeptidase